MILSRLAAELVFWILFTINIASVAIIAERFWFFWRRRIDADQVARHLLNFLRLRDLPRARALLLRYNAPECTVLLAGLGELEHGRPAAVEAMKSARAREQIRMEVNLGPLKAIAQAAPLLGVLGTIFGVLGAIPDTGTALIDKQNVLSPVLSGALRCALDDSWRPVRRTAGTGRFDLIPTSHAAGAAAWGDVGPPCLGRGRT